MSPDAKKRARNARTGALIALAVMGLRNRVARYRLSLQQTFVSVHTAKATETEVLDGLASAFTRDAGKVRFKDGYTGESFSRRVEEMYSWSHASEVYAGAIIVICDNLLQDYIAQIKTENPGEWQCGVPLNGLVCFCKVLRAASNAVRHQDEWTRRIKPPLSTARKKNAFKQAFDSIDVLRAVIPSTFESVYFSMEEVLQVLSIGDFDILEQRLLKAAEALAGANDIGRAGWELGLSL
jgi:hypothetical protein